MLKTCKIRRYRLKYRAMILIDSLAHISLTGFEPWYAGLSRGWAGRGDRSLNGMAVYDSKAWLHLHRNLVLHALHCDTAAIQYSIWFVSLIERYGSVRLQGMAAFTQKSCATCLTL